MNLGIQQDKNGYYISIKDGIDGIDAGVFTASDFATTIETIGCENIIAFSNGNFDLFFDTQAMADSCKKEMIDQYKIPAEEIDDYIEDSIPNQLTIMVSGELDLFPFVVKNYNGKFKFHFYIKDKKSAERGLVKMKELLLLKRLYYA